MYAVYSLLLTIGLIVLAPHFLVQALLHGKYIDGLRQRLGFLPPSSQTDKPVIWIHCVSVGEAQAARPLIEQLRSEFPDHSLVVSTITNTGQKLAQTLFQSTADRVFYFPFDWRWSVRRALKIVKPSAVLIMETELWPNFLRECRVTKVPVALVNGRISRQSFRNYSWIQSFVTRVLSCLSLAVMQSEVDAERIGALGLAKEKLLIAGNLKFDASSPTFATENTELKTRFNLNGEVPVLLAASTHNPEEKLLLEVFRELKKTKSARLVLAPRRPESFQDVASLLKQSGLKWARRTNSPHPEDVNAEVILLDTIGELPATYSLVKIVFVGGSLIDRGGHNVLEPASAGVCVVTGAYTHNFHAIVQLLTEAEALVQLPPFSNGEVTEELTNIFRTLLTDKAKCNEIGQRAKQLVIENHGATARTLELIRPLISKPDSTS
jgi:3-deoxy-D-manno-octulosonic-acid transferase